MTQRVTIIGLDDRGRWEEAHRSGGLPSQSWSYASGFRAAGIEPQLAVVSADNARMLLPFHERDWNGATDVSTLIGLSGASIEPSSSAPLAAWRAYATSRGWVAGYLQLAPGTGDVGGDPEDALVTSNEVVRLVIGEGDPLAGAAEIIRRKLRRAERAGVRCAEDRGQLADAMVRLYPETMRRLRMPSRCDYPQAALRTWTTDSNTVAVAAELAGRIEAVSLFPWAGDVAEYHLNACSESGRTLAAWLIAQAIPRLRACGVRTLNLGGGIRPGDGLHEFKSRFHGTPLPLRALRQVYDRPRYEALCHSAGANPESRWFPAYRSSEADR